MKRPVAAAVTIMAIVMLAVVSAPRLELDYAPRFALPELFVSLWLRDGAADPVDTTTRWVVPIESAIRSLGDVRATRAQVRGDGASITVRFGRGVDAEVKAARLASELASLRAKLPRNAALNVYPSTGNRPAAILAVPNAAAAQRLGEALRSARGVRDVMTYGDTEREVEIRLRRGADARAVQDALATSLAPRFVGHARKNLAVLFAPDAKGLEDVHAGPIRLGALAEVVPRLAQPFDAARVNGKPAVMLALYREDDVSLFTFDASVRERARGFDVTEVWSDATELRALLRRAAMAMLVASLLLAATGFVMHGPRGLALALYPLVAVALTMNVYRLAGVRVDAAVIVLALIAYAGVAPFAVARMRPFIGALMLVLLPIAAIFGSGALAPLITPSAIAFLIAGVCALSTPLPLAGEDSRAAGEGLRRLLRKSATVVLVATTITTLLLAYFGRRLDPREQQSSEPSRLNIEVTLPAGTTLAQTTTAVERVEKSLRELKGIARFWSFVEPGSATISLELGPAVRSATAMQQFRIQLRSVVPFAPGIVTIGESGRNRSRFDVDVEDEPRADDQGFVYRILLKGTDAEALRRTADVLTTRLARQGVFRSMIHQEWPPAAARVELVPRRDTTPAEAAQAAALLAEHTLPPSEQRLPDGTIARVIAHGAPRTIDDAPQRADLFTRLPALASKFEQRTAFVPGGVTRELGRFVLPVSISVPGHDESEKLRRREEIDRSISLYAPPGGVIIDRPSLSDWTFSLQKLRMLALAGMLPVLLFAASSIVLASLRGAFAALATSTAGVSFAAPALLAASAQVDEMALLAIAASVCCTTAIAVATLLRARNDTVSTYRAVRALALPSIAATATMVIMLTIVATLPAAARDGWRAPLLAAAAVLAGGVPAAVLVAPAIGILARDAQRRRTVAARNAARPVEWTSGAPMLEVRNVTKHYASGFRALHRVSFELAPGIVGLLGPNGAGKTTLLRILTGLLLPTRGQVSFRGVAVGPHNLAEYRTRIGFLPQEFNAYAGLTAFDFLDYWALERGMKDRGATVERLLATVGLENDAGRRVRDFSGGMRQRIGIARALLGDPPLLVVDEPTTGLDLESRNRFRDLLVSLAGERIIILSTHIAGDVEATASRILMLSRGTLRWDGTPAALIGRARGRVFEAVVSESDTRALTTHYRVTTRQRVAGGVRVRGVVPAGVTLPGVACEPTLEEAYLAEAAGERALRASGFAFLFDRERRTA